MYLESGFQNSVPDVAVIKLKPRREDTEGLDMRRTIMTLHLDLMKRKQGNGEINLEINSLKQNVLS